MGEYKIQRKEAIKLITPVADGEAAKDQSRAFFHYIQYDTEVKRRFEEEKWIKHIIRHQLPRYQAPASLRKKINHFLLTSIETVSLE